MSIDKVRKRGGRRRGVGESTIGRPTLKTCTISCNSISSLGRLETKRYLVSTSLASSSSLTRLFCSEGEEEEEVVVAGVMEDEKKKEDESSASLETEELKTREGVAVSSEEVEEDRERGEEEEEGSSVVVVVSWTQKAGAEAEVEEAAAMGTPTGPTGEEIGVEGEERLRFNRISWSCASWTS